MSTPRAALALCALLIAFYFHASGGLLFIPDSTVNSLALDSPDSPLNFFSHLFVHVGVVHLVGNVIPLLVFAIIFELAATSLDVLVVFLFSGVLSSIVFSLLNPGVALVGASAGVSGLIGAAVSARPRLALPFLILIPLAFNFLVMPSLAQLALGQQVSLYEKENQLSKQFTQLVSENNSAEAAVVSEQLSEVSAQKQVVEKGIQREASTPIDLLVHLLGVVVGVGYVFVFKRSLFVQGASGFRESLLLLIRAGSGGKRKPNNQKKGKK